jgi:uncharacterized phage infection (PIP) family protein YhgE
MTSGAIDDAERNRYEKTSGTEKAKCECPGESRWSQFGSIGGLAVGLCLVCLAVIVMAGCGKQKEELESAKQQIERLSAETKNLTESFAGLGKEKERLNDSMTLLSEKNAALEREVAALEKAKASVDRENRKLKDEAEQARKEVASLKQQKIDLERETETLKKGAGTSLTPLKEPETGVTEDVSKPGAQQSASKPPQAASPCDAVLQYMKKSQAIVRQYKGEERAKLLQQVKEEFSSLMRGAPEKAIKAADLWVNEVVRVWDNPREDSAFILLSNKKRVLESCHKTPEEAGF